MKKLVLIIALVATGSMFARNILEQAGEAIGSAAQATYRETMGLFRDAKAKYDELVANPDKFEQAEAEEIKENYRDAKDKFESAAQDAGHSVKMSWEEIKERGAQVLDDIGQGAQEFWHGIKSKF